MPNILSADDANFVSSTGNWSPTLSTGGSPFLSPSATLSRTTSPAPHGGVGQTGVLTNNGIYASSERVDVTASIGYLLSSVPAIPVPSIYAVAPGDFYSFSCWVMTTATVSGETTHVIAALNWYDASGTLLGGTGAEPPALIDDTSPWTQLSTIGRAPNNAAWGAVLVTAQFNYYGASTTSDHVGAQLLFSDVSLYHYAQANAVLTATPISGAPPLSVVFDGSGTTGDPATTINWQLVFHDGSTPGYVSGTSLPVPSAIPHTYTAPGIYTPYLSVSPSVGGTSLATVTIVVTATSGWGIGGILMG